MKFRHEYKHEINYGDLISLRQRLRAVASQDQNSIDGTYHIRSIYFDNLRDKALIEKVSGVNKREKFRVRLYNYDNSFINLEKKSKINGLTSKESVRISLDEATRLQAGDYDWMKEDERELVRELRSKMQTQCLRPRTIVDYDREAYVYAPGNVRVTFDYNIRTGLYRDDFLNPDCPTIPAGDSGIILEVKWDEFLPDLIRDAVYLRGRHASAFSKYAACRIYG